jgi:hypothetical protein
MPGINKMTRSVDESSYMKPRLVGKQEEIDMNKDKKITKEDFSMLRAKMAMPKKNSPSNFPAIAEEMAKAMDYNSSKPMMYGSDKPKMDHGKNKTYKKKK